MAEVSLGMFYFVCHKKAVEFSAETNGCSAPAAFRAAWHGHKGLCSDVAKAKYVDLALHLGLIPPREVKGSAAKAGGARVSRAILLYTLSVHLHLLLLSYGFSLL